MGTTKKASVDSTGYHNARVAKAMSLYDKAKSEKLGSDYEKKYSQHLDKAVSDKISYAKRKAATPGKSIAGLKSGGKVTKSKRK